MMAGGRMAHIFGNAVLQLTISLSKNISPNCGNLLPGIMAICVIVKISRQKARFQPESGLRISKPETKKFKIHQILWFCGREAELLFFGGCPPQNL